MDLYVTLQEHAITEPKRSGVWPGTGQSPVGTHFKGVLLEGEDGL